MSGPPELRRQDAGTSRVPAPFRHRNFARLLAARFSNGMATNMLYVIVGWEVYKLTGNPLDLGLLGLAEFLPSLAFFLVTGLVADRLRRHVIISGCYVVQTLAALVLAWTLSLAAPPLPFILAVLFVMGTTRAFAMPAGQALLPNTVPEGQFTHAVAWSSSSMQVAIIVGPALGGLLLAAGSTNALAVVIGLYAVAAFAAGGISVPRERRRSEPVRFATVVAGLGFIRRRQVILGAISLDLFAVLLGGATALLPVYASDILHVGGAGLGFLRSAMAVGAMLCGLVLTQRPVRRHCGRMLLVTIGIFGLAILVFGLSRSYWLSLSALFVAGMADMVNMFIRMTLVQLATPDDMRGRVSAVNSMFIGASNQLGEFESGVAAALLGVVPAVVVGGLGTVLVAVFWGRLFPLLRAVDRLDPDELRRSGGPR